jgi:DNA-directed RNA polymerase subunit M/transcription elongation factor TFIIS
LNAGTIIGVMVEVSAPADAEPFVANKSDASAQMPPRTDLAIAAYRARLVGIAGPAAAEEILAQVSKDIGGEHGTCPPGTSLASVHSALRALEAGRHGATAAGGGAPPVGTWGELVRDGRMGWRSAVLGGLADIAASPRLSAALTPRDDARRLLARYLRCAESAARDSPKSLGAEARAQMAVHLETLCYKKVHAASIAAGGEQRWTSPAFRAGYSLAVGAVTRTLGGQGTLAADIWSSTGASLARRLLAGDVSPEDVVAGRGRARLPEDQRLRAKVAYRSQLSRRNKNDVTKASVLYRCPRCGARNAKYEEHHTRAVDEAKTVLCVCQSCGENFRGRE